MASSKEAGEFQKVMKLLILTKKYGRNFTGATLATQYFVGFWSKAFEKIDVFTLQLGTFENINNVKIHKCISNRNLVQEISNTIYREHYDLAYSDDHLGYLLSKLNIRYVHTYHGNWPDARKVSFSNFIKSFYFIPCYRKTITNATRVVNVSHYMETFTKQFNPNSIVIRNGIDLKKENDYNPAPGNKFLMVGNVDRRKYEKAIELGKVLNCAHADIEIDVYGRIDDNKVAKKLSETQIFYLKGLVDAIPYGKYKGLINTSIIENLSISVCEAILNNIPVICFNVGGLSEVVNPDTGVLVDNFNVSTMASYLLEYMKSPTRKLVIPDALQNFNWIAASNQYLAIFKNLIMNEY